jgi:hypothetical protein
MQREAPTYQYKTKNITLLVFTAVAGGNSLEIRSVCKRFNRIDAASVVNIKKHKKATEVSAHKNPTSGKHTYMF